jgi:bifunctional non-homologous end joining protein LigD
MALDKYKEKRNFKKTAEPTGGDSHSDKLIFVVQKHDASHLHYDFRLEVKGVLKSWAVPRGPSMNPDERRLAMPVEDHPYNYRNFEGTIPKGQYGGGTVIVWDEGWYEPATEEPLKDKASMEHWMMSNYYKNALKVTLHGHKLKGDFILIKFKDDKYEGGWRLIKADDKRAIKKDILLKDKSVLSGLTIEQMALSKDAKVWNSNRNSEQDGVRAVTNSPAAAKEQGVKEDMPTSISPMLCTLTKKPIEDEDYFYEIKWDGYRIISFVDGRNVKMNSRSSLDYTSKYPPIVEALRAIGHKAVLDGEVVVFNEEGKPDFDALQKYNGHNTPIAYCVFDILWLDGYSLKGLPLNERKEILQQLVEGSEVLKYSESFDDGIALYQHSVELNLEGIVAKRKHSTYQENARGTDWLKTPTRKRQEFVIGGWAESDKSRSFRSLLFGAFKDGKFEWIGRSGGGYKDKDMTGILKSLQTLEVPKSPFVNKVLDTKGATIHWVKPELVANFEFATWTKSGRIRKPATFLGFRKDKNALDVVREVPLSNAVQENIAEEGTKPIVLSSESNWGKIINKKITSEQEFDLAGHIITLNNIEQEIWKGVNKAQLISYYHSVCPYILPYLKDRPLSLHIKDNGANAPGFYIKDMEGQQPEFAQIYRTERKHKAKGKRDIIDYLVCNDEATLLYIVNLGCIDVNPWCSRTISADNADYISIDLDPSDDDFSKAIKTALAAKQVFDKYKLKAFVKTSGKTGIHLFIPCKDFTFPQARILSETLCKQTSQLVPHISTTEVNIAHRGTKLFVDPSQNDFADTLASAYSVRPNRSPTVSTPLEWEEVNENLNSYDFTINNILERIEEKGDLFAGVLDAKIAKENSLQLKKLL